LNTDIKVHIGSDLRLYTVSITAALCSLGLLGAILLRTVAMLAATTTQFATDNATISAQQSGDLADSLLEFQEVVNLVSFLSAEVLVHLATWISRFE
jgi:hypothetical protein